MAHPSSDAYVSRGGDKLTAALDHFKVDVTGCICADLGSHVGGFVDCLLQCRAARVYSVDTCYGTLAWKLRRDSRVVVMERTNAMHVSLPEVVDLVTIDLGWTPQSRILPNAAKLLGATGSSSASGSNREPRQNLQCSRRTNVTDTRCVLTLIKPHYESPSELLVDGVLPDAAVDEVVDGVLQEIMNMGWAVGGTFTSPIRGHAGNREVFALLTRS